ncbi:MAG: BCD family MFS transporter [Pseudomonadota bacterium]
MKKNSKLYTIILSFQLTLPRATTGWCFAILTSNYNRIAIYELGIAAVTITTLLGLYHFVSPFQVIFGRLADRFPIFGYRRSPYILMGLLVTSIAVAGLPSATLAMSEGSTWGYVGAFGLLVLFGIGFAMSGVTHLSLVADVIPPERRGLQVAMIWAMLLVGMIVSLAFIRSFMPVYDYETMQMLYFLTIPIVGGVTLLSLIGVETRLDRAGVKALKDAPREHEHDNPMVALWHFVKNAATGDNTRHFFLFIFVAMMGINMQDNILEVFGAQVLGMTVGETGRFQQVWGSGALVGMFLMGLITMKFSISKVAAITAGTVGAGASLALLGWSSLTANSSSTLIALVSFGFFNGFFLVGSLTAMMDMTTEEDRGSYMGLWGLAIALSNGFASIIGGAMVSGFIETGLTSPEVGYGGIFLLEAALVVYALTFIRKVDTNRLKNIDRDSMAGAMEADM